MKNSLYALNSIEEPFAPKHPKYEKVSARAASFIDNWPTNIRIDIEKLIMQGLFYTGKWDYLVCYHCGGGFRNIREDDDLMKLHAILYGGCQFLFRIYSVDTIFNLIEAPPTILQWRKAFTPSKNDFIIENTKLKDMEIQRLQQQIVAMRRMHLIHLNNTARQNNIRINGFIAENRRLDTRVRELSILVECPVCLSATKNAVILCGHACCDTCLDNVDSCPVCRQEFNSKHELYL